MNPKLRRILKQTFVFLIVLASGFWLFWCSIFLLLSIDFLGTSDPAMTRRYTVIVTLLVFIYIPAMIMLLKIKKALYAYSIPVTIALILAAPTISQLYSDFDEWMLSRKENSKVLKISKEIKYNELPYDIDIGRSNLKSNTSSSKTFIFLTNRSNQEINKSDIIILSNISIENTNVSINSFELKWPLSLYFDSKKEISECSPVDKCKELFD